jgi:hypothetical protein
MAQDVDQAAKAVVDARFDEEMEDFVEWMTSGAKMRHARGVKRGGERTETHRVDI